MKSESINVSGVFSVSVSVKSETVGGVFGATYGVTDIVAVAVSVPPWPSDTVYVNEASPEKSMAGVNVHC